MRFRHIENNGLIRLVGGVDRPAQGDLVQYESRWKQSPTFITDVEPSFGETLTEVSWTAHGGQAPALSLQGTGRYQLEGMAWLGGSYARMISSEPFINNNAGLELTQVLLLGDGIELTASNIATQNWWGEWAVPTIYSQSLTNNDALVRAVRAADSTDAAPGLVFGGRTIVRNAGVLEADGADLWIVGGENANLVKPGDSRFEHAGQLIARAGSGVEVYVPTQVQSGGEVLAHEGGRVAFHQAVQVDADAALWVDVQQDANVHFERGITADNATQVVANVQLKGGTATFGPSQAGAGGGIVTRSGNSAENPVQLMGPRGRVALEAGVQLPAIWVATPGQLLDGGTFVWSGIDLELDRDSGFDLSVLAATEGSFAPLDWSAVNVRNRVAIELHGNGPFGSLVERITENYGSIELKAAGLTLPEGLLVDGTERELPGGSMGLLSLDQGSTLELDGDLVIGPDGTVEIEDPSRNAVEINNLLIDGGSLLVQASPLGPESGFDWLDLPADGRVIIRSNTLPNGQARGGTLTVASFDDPYDHEFDLLLEGPGAEFNRLDALSSNRGVIELTAGQKVTVGNLSVDNFGAIVVDASLLSIPGNEQQPSTLHLHPSSQLHVRGGGSVVADRIDDQSGARLDGGFLLSEELTIHQGRSVKLDQDGGIRSDLIRLDGALTFGTGETESRFGTGTITGKLIPGLESRMEFDIAGTQAGIDADHLTLTGGWENPETEVVVTQDATQNHVSPLLHLRLDPAMELQIGLAVEFLELKLPVEPEAMEPNADLTLGAYFEQVQVTMNQAFGDEQSLLTGSGSAAYWDGLPGVPMFSASTSRFLGTWNRSDGPWDIYFDQAAGDGNDLALVFIPEPAMTLIWLIGCATLRLRPLKMAV